MKLHWLRVSIPSDDKVLLKDVQEKLRGMFDARGIEQIGPVAEDLAGPIRRARIHWPAADVLQHADTTPALPTVVVRAKRKKAARVAT